MQIQTQWHTITYLLELLKLTKFDNSKTYLCATWTLNTTGRNINWYHFGYLLKLNMLIHLDLAITLLSIYPTEICT